MTDDELLDIAREVRDKAHCPYSGFSVGAALIDENGKVHVGCNVENARVLECELCRGRRYQRDDFVRGQTYSNDCGRGWRQGREVSCVYTLWWLPTTYSRILGREDSGHRQWTTTIPGTVTRWQNCCLARSTCRSPAHRATALHPRPAALGRKQPLTRLYTQWLLLTQSGRLVR